MKYVMQSFSSPDQRYVVDKALGHCSCPAFASEGWCKHLEAVGAYRPRKVNLTSRPSFSQALSGLVKSIRVRNIQEAVYWLGYCWGFRERINGTQFRTVRRLLIGAAEDGHSVSVMERMADVFQPLLAKDVQLEKVVVELVRICKVPNWWHPASGGPDYIYAGMIASREMLYHREAIQVQEALGQMEQAIDAGDATKALRWAMLVGNVENSLSLIATRLLGIATVRNHQVALRLLRNIYLRHGAKLGGDNNFITQAVWWLCGGGAPVVDEFPSVGEGEAVELLEAARSMYPHVIPGWCCDGIHCAGADVRYAGMWDRMYAVCRQFECYQRLDPNDEWLEVSFYSMDGHLLLRP